MLGKIIIVTFFVVILYNLFMGLKYLMRPASVNNTDNSEKLYKKLKQRIAMSMVLFFIIVAGFLTGLIQLHTL